MVSGRLALWRLFILGRSVVTGCFLVLLVLMNGPLPAAPLRPLYLLALVQFVTNAFYLYLWRRREIASLGYVAFGLEIALISLVILLLGHDGFVFVLAYLWPIIMAGWLIGRRAIPPLTLFGIVAYGLLVFLEQRAWLPAPPLILSTGTSQALVLCLPYLAFVSLLVWLLTREMEGSARHLQVRNRDLHRVNFALRYLVAAGEELLGCASVPAVTTLALQKMAKLTGLGHAAVYLNEGGTLALGARIGLTPDFGARHPVPRVPDDWGLPGGQQVGALHVEPLAAEEAAQLVAGGCRAPTALTHIALRSGRGLEGVLTIATPDGEPFDRSEARILQVFGHQLGVALENVRLLDNLQHERDLLGGILAQMADGVLVVGGDGRVLLANTVARGLFGVGQGEALPDWLVARMGEGDGEPGARQTIGAAGRVVALSVATLAAGDGVPSATIYVARDVTQEVELDRAKSDFVGYVSHELRTPLTTIKMLVRLLLMDASAEGKQREYLTVIDTQIARQTHLVNNLLDLTRLEAGKYDLPLEPVNPRAVIQTAMNVCAPLAHQKGLHLTVDCPSEAPAIVANAGGLEQVLINLLGNAVKFTDPGGSVDVSCGVDGDALRLAVRDTGVGMRAEELGRVFDKFYTARHPGKRGEGTGLGLVISKMIVQALGGSITVESRAGEGSCFTVRLPLPGAAEAPEGVTHGCTVTVPTPT